MDAATSFFFKLEMLVAQRKQMVCFRLLHGRLTFDTSEMRKHGVVFFADLFGAEFCDRDAAAELLQDLPQLSPEDLHILSTDLSLKDLSSSVTQMATGKSQCFHALPPEFYEHIWNLLESDLLNVFRDCFKNETLPAPCQHAVIFLLPKNGDTTLLKNQRPVAPLCTDYNLLSKALSNKWKDCIILIIDRTQTYCCPDGSIIIYF